MKKTNIRLIFTFIVCIILLLNCNPLSISNIALSDNQFNQTLTLLVPTTIINNIVSINTPTPTNTPSFLLSTNNSDNSYPLIANLWGVFKSENHIAIGTNYDLIIPYTFSNAETISKTVYQMNPKAIILHTQYATKGRPDSDELFNKWWQSSLGDPGYACLFRDSKGNILTVAGWQQPMVNMINSYCRDIILQKNIDEYISVSRTNSGNQIYKGIYWDLLFGKISWLGDDIDSNLDGIPDDLVQLDADYKKSVLTFLHQMQLELPDAVKIGNEATVDYSKYINGRLFEWQLQSYLDGLQLYSWESITNDYRKWALLGVEPQTTIIENAPEEGLIKKYSYGNINQIPDALITEASTSYQRMRFGLTSALMGDGFYSFDLGQMYHGQFWWYDEFGHIDAGEQSNAVTLPPQGYLGQPVSNPYKILSEPIKYITDIVGNRILLDQPTTDKTPDPTENVWARQFEFGMAIINPTSETRKVELPKKYCKLNGDQAPLFQERIDDDLAKVDGNWQIVPASWNQFGDIVHSINPPSDGSIMYTLDLPFTGQYEVFTWIEPSSNLSKKVVITINNSIGKSLQILDETTGDIGWHSLGTFTFDYGTNGNIVFYSSDKKVVADAIKIVSVARYNDGSASSSILIQPKDGIVLVDCLSK
jgi:hypothetical protein